MNGGWKGCEYKDATQTHINKHGVETKNATQTHTNKQGVETKDATQTYTNKQGVETKDCTIYRIIIDIIQNYMLQELQKRVCIQARKFFQNNNRRI